MSKNNDCDVCRNHHEFDIPNEILEAVKNGNLVLFAGAGISTEGKGVFPKSFYQEISDELNKKDYNQSFSEIMEEYCSKNNGRIKLVKKFIERLDYVESFQEMKNTACKFYDELQTLYMINEIITTNWDNYFENICGCIPFVVSKDFALTGTQKRKVYKIHGSINNLGTIVATKSDYEECYKQLHSGLIGSKLKLLLSDSEKQIVFIGYSLTDEDFVRIIEFLEDELGEFMPHYYIVTLDENIEKKINTKKYTPIITDATYFLSKLKSKLIEEDYLLEDRIYEFAYIALQEVSKVHLDISENDITRYPDLVYSMVYQDGLIHCYQRVIAMKKVGYYSNNANIQDSIRGYVNLLEEKEIQKDYYNQAYIDGYLNGLISLDNRKYDMFPPFFYSFSDKEVIYTLNKYMKKRKKIIEENKCKIDYIKEKLKDKKNIIAHHPPFIFD